MAIIRATPTMVEKAASMAVAAMMAAGVQRFVNLRYLYAIPNSGYAALGTFRVYLPTIDGEPTRNSLVVLDAYLPELAHQTLVVDDVYASGKTAAPYIAAGSDLLVLYGSEGMTNNPHVFRGAYLADGDYVVFPWEGDASGPEDAVRRLLQFIGRDPDDPAVADTPRRVLSWLSEFSEAKEPIVATTFDGIEYNGMVIARDIPFVSMCEHHLLPFTGHAAIGYIPEGGRVLGLSKLARLLHVHARRSQVQERLTTEVHGAIVAATGAASVAVVLRAEHLCMSLRGPAVPGHTTVTSELSGSFREVAPRAEFLSIVHARFDK